MKRYGNLYDKICSKDNIVLAHQQARKGKTWYKEVQMVDANPEKYLGQIEQLLKNKTFVNSKYETFEKTFNNKHRVIYKLPYFPDRIIHHCIVQVIEPICESTYIRNTFSSIKQRGVHDGVRRLKSDLHDTDNTAYCLKMDVHKFYPSVKHEVMKQLVARKIKCKDTLWLINHIIDSTDGLPIGNYLSQHLANLYLSWFDHFVKEQLQCRYYYRYCDDMVLLHSDKSTLHKWRQKIATELNEKYCLSIKNTWQIFKVDSRGIDFMGYRFFHGFTLLRKRIKNNMITKLRKAATAFEYTDVIRRYNSWLCHADTYRLVKKYEPKIA